MAGTAFEQLYTQNGGKIDGVVSANDTMAGGIIARLKANNLAGKVPVTGQDASVAGLQAILAGQQCMTVYKAVKKEADAASALAIALIKGQDTASIVNGSVKDTVLNKDVPSALETPVSIFKANVKDVIDDGFQKASDVCTAAVRLGLPGGRYLLTHGGGPVRCGPGPRSGSGIVPHTTGTRLGEEVQHDDAERNRDSAARRATGNRSCRCAP